MQENLFAFALFLIWMLTGKRGKYNTDNGEKFIAVEAGGKLGIHWEEPEFVMQT